MLKIAVLCSDYSHHDYLVARMQASFQISLIVRERASGYRDRLWRQHRWIDYYYWQYHRIRRWALGLSSYRREDFAQKIVIPPDRLVPQIVTEDINDSKVVHALQQVEPDLTVIMGTSILKKDVLCAAGPAIVNIHGGYLPWYRGNHCFFFALYQREFDKIGSTIHFVNQGIDTGDIIERVVPEIGPADNAEALYSRAEKMAIERLVELVRSFQNGVPFPRTPQQFKGRLYLTRDRKIRHDLIHWARSVSGAHQKALAAWKNARPEPGPVVEPSSSVAKGNLE
jgi:methionyl-tRNA formyltransferase